MRKIFGLFKVAPGILGVYAVIIFVWNCLVLFSAVCIQYLFDVFGKSNQSTNNIYIGVIILVIVYIARGFMALLVSCFESWGGFIIDSFLKMTVVRGIYTSYAAMFSAKSSGEIHSILKDDIVKIKNYVVQLTECIVLFIYLCILLYTLYQINPSVLFVIIGLAFLTVVIIRKGFTSLSRVYTKVREENDAVVGFTGEVLKAIFQIKFAGTQKYILDYYEDIGKKRVHIRLKESILKQSLYSVNNFIFEIGEGIILLLTFRLIQEGTFTIGNFALFALLIDGIASIMQMTADTIVQTPQVKVSMERFETLLSEFEWSNKHSEDKINQPKQLFQEEITENREKKNKFKKIKFSGLCCISQGERKILQDINLVLERGSITVVAGKSGSGKTMLIRTLFGYYPTSKGVILWDEIPIVEPSNFFIPPNVAYVSQDPKFFSESILNNVCIQNKNVDLHIIFSKCALIRDLLNMESRENTLMGNNGRKVSVGQKKRIALARAYATNSQIYVLDDVFNALDVETEFEILRKIKEQEECTFVMVSNSKNVLEIADNIVYMENGEIVAQGTMEEIKMRVKDMEELLK